VSPDHIAGAIATVQETFYSELRSLPEEFASWHPAHGEWCAKEVLGHVIESERTGFAGRIREILAADNPALKATGPLSPGYCERPLLPLLDEFRRQRETSVALVKGLAAEDLERVGVHERVGRLTVNDLLHEWVHHDRAHLKQLLDNVQKYVWPDMGGAQKFSA
jgi:hypothetical protein